MIFTLETPAMIFPAISLLMLAYTNRFVVLAGLIRDLYDRQKDTPNKQILAQISNLQNRMNYIKKMQVLGALSFIGAIISMVLSMISQFDMFGIPSIGLIYASCIIFTLSLILLIISLFYLLKELSISIEALTIQLDDLKEKH